MEAAAKNQRQIQADAAREALIEAASELFAERGYHDSSVAEIGEPGRRIETGRRPTGGVADHRHGGDPGGEQSAAEGGAGAAGGADDMDDGGHGACA